MISGAELSASERVEWVSRLERATLQGSCRYGRIDSCLQLLRFCLLVLPASASNNGSGSNCSARASDAEYSCLDHLLQFFLSLCRSMRLLMSAQLLSNVLQTFLQMLSSYALVICLLHRDFNDKYCKLTLSLR